MVNFLFWRRLAKHRRAVQDIARQQKDIRRLKNPHAQPVDTKGATVLGPLRSRTAATVQTYSKDSSDAHPSVEILLDQSDNLGYESQCQQRDQCIFSSSQQSGMYIKIQYRVPLEVDALSGDAPSKGSSIYEASKSAASFADGTRSCDDWSISTGYSDDCDDDYDPDPPLCLGSCGDTAIVGDMILCRNCTEGPDLPRHPGETNDKLLSPVWDLGVTWDPTLLENGRARDDRDETDSLVATSYAAFPRRMAANTLHPNKRTQAGF